MVIPPSMIRYTERTRQLWFIAVSWNPKLNTQNTLALDQPLPCKNNTQRQVVSCSRDCMCGSTCVHCVESARERERRGEGWYRTVSVPSLINEPISSRSPNRDFYFRIDGAPTQQGLISITAKSTWHQHVCVRSVERARDKKRGNRMREKGTDRVTGLCPI